MNPTATMPAPTTLQLHQALNYFRRHYGPATLDDIRAAADPRRSWHTLAELRALDHAGIPHR